MSSFYVLVAEALSLVKAVPFGVLGSLHSVAGLCAVPLRRGVLERACIGVLFERVEVTAVWYRGG